MEGSFLSSGAGRCRLEDILQMSRSGDRKPTPLQLFQLTRLTIVKHFCLRCINGKGALNVVRPKPNHQGIHCNCSLMSASDALSSSWLAT